MHHTKPWLTSDHQRLETCKAFTMDYSLHKAKWDSKFLKNASKLHVRLANLSIPTIYKYLSLDDLELNLGGILMST
jgi:hypothetical protein